MAPKLVSDGPLGIIVPKSDSGRSRRSGKNQSESGRSGRSRKNRDARSATPKVEAAAKKDEEEPTVAAGEPPSLASVRLTQKSGSIATAASSSSMAPGEKTCEFMCGTCGSMPDPLEPEKRKCCRWARDPTDPEKATGYGTCCYYCERLWYGEAHKHDRDRIGFQSKLALCLSTLRDWRERRSNYISMLKDKAAGLVEKRSGGVKKVTLKRKRFNQTSLIRPEDAFYPIARYEKKYGSPLLQKNKALGHKVAKIDGVKGVIVPGDDGLQPFRLQRRSGEALEEDKEEDVGSTDGEEEMADDKFATMSLERNTAYDEMATGCLQSILDDYALKEGEDSQPKKPQNRKKKKKIAAEGSAARKKPWLFGMLAAVADDDDDDEADEDFACGGKALKQKPKANMPKPTKAGPGRTEAKPNKKASSANAEAEMLLLGDEDEGAKKGRPSKNPSQVADMYWKHLQNGELHEHFFGENNNTMRRLLIRWLKVASDRAIKDDSTENAHAKRKLQLMESSIAMSSSWKNRRSIAIGISGFMRDWSLLVTNLKQTPPLDLRCEYLWNLYHEVQTNRTMDPSVDMVPMLTGESLKSQYPPGVDVDTTQEFFTRQWVAGAVSMAKKKDDARAALARLAQAVLKPDLVWQFNGNTQAHCLILNDIVSPPPLSLNGNVLARLTASNAMVKVPADCKGTMLGPLFEFPELSSLLLEDMDSTVQLWQDYHKFCDNLAKHPVMVVENWPQEGLWHAVLPVALDLLDTFYADRNEEFRKALTAEEPHTELKIKSTLQAVSLKLEAWAHADWVHRLNELAVADLDLLTMQESGLLEMTPFQGLARLVKFRSMGENKDIEMMTSTLKLLASDSFSVSAIRKKASASHFDAAWFQKVLGACEDLMEWVKKQSTQTSQCEAVLSWASGSLMPLLVHTVHKELDESKEVVRKMFLTLQSKIDDGSGDPDAGFVAEFEAAASKLEGGAVPTRIEKLRLLLVLRWCRMVLSFRGLEKSSSPFVLDLEFIKAAGAFVKRVESMTQSLKSCEGDAVEIDKGFVCVYVCIGLLFLVVFGFLLVRLI